MRLAVGVAVILAVLVGGAILISQSGPSTSGDYTGAETSAAFRAAGIGLTQEYDMFNQAQGALFFAPTARQFIVASKQTADGITLSTPLPVFDVAVFQSASDAEQALALWTISPGFYLRKVNVVVDGDPSVKRYAATLRKALTLLRHAKAAS